MLTLFSWYLKDHGPAVLAHGIVSGHPKLPEGSAVHTSSLVHGTEAEGGILLETRSGRLYRLDPAELSAEAGGPGLPLPDPTALGLAADLWERCIQSRDQAFKRETDGLRALEAPGTLRLCVVDTTALSALWRGPGELVRPIPVETHIGHLQDSVLVTDLFGDEPGSHRVDLRYFPLSHQMKPYRIYAGIDTILIVNKGLQAVSFGHEGQEILCLAGETTRIAVTHPTRSDFQINRI